MPVLGNLYIGSRPVVGASGGFRAYDPDQGVAIEPLFNTADAAQGDAACDMAAEAFQPYRQLDLETRAAFLETIADRILDLGDELIVRAVSETGLPRARIEGEKGRAVGQLRLFAQVVRRGDFLEARIDHAILDRLPAPRPDLRLRKVPLGPVAVFGASNFPLAFSVVGGDTASAFAAGCPVVVKGHSAHPGVSELAASAVAAAVEDCGVPPGVFSMLLGSGVDVGTRLVAHPAIKAVGFTGSRTGGVALMKVAQARREPIPVYAEMSSINPIILFPGAVRDRGAAIGAEFVQALTLGAGQFCTNPGLVLALETPALADFIASAARAMEASVAATMLTPGIHQAYRKGIEALQAHAEVGVAAEGQARDGCRAQPVLFTTDAESFLKHETLSSEVFGPASLVVKCADPAELISVIESLEGQLTAGLHISENDYADAARIVPLLEIKVGRILVNGFGTGVEVADAMVHGGPFPATSDGRSTSVGTLAIDRFLRPVSYQNLPAQLLPDGLDDANTLRLRRLEDGGRA